MKIAIGATILLIGPFVFWVDASRIPLDAGSEFMSGYFLPAGAIIVLGIVIPVWNSKKVPQVTLNCFMSNNHFQPTWRLRQARG